MSKKSLIHLSVIFSSLSILSISSTAHSAGFALIENSASGMGKAFAGAAASAEDASTVWFNPAGMTYLGDELEGKSQLTNSGHIIRSKVKYSDKGSAAPASLLTTMDGETETSETLHAFVPNLYFTKRIKPRLDFGISVNGPFGSKTLYDDDWIGRYHATETDMKTVNINPSLSWKMNEKLSIGGGISAQYIHVTLGKSVDSGAACRQVALASGSTDILDTCSAGYPEASKVEKDSQVVVEGDDVSFGFNVGILFKASPKTRLGASYRSKVKHDLTGEIEFELDPTLGALAQVLDAQGNTSFTNRDIEASVELPDMLSLSFAHKYNSRLEILGDYTWTGWSSFPELLITDAADGSDVTRTPEEWEDSSRISIGANYKYNEKLTLRTGLAWDETPIPSVALMTPRIPGNDRTWLSFGAGYKMNKHLNFDFGYTHLLIDETAIDNTDDAGYSIRGLYKNNIDILSAQANYTFK